MTARNEEAIIREAPELNVVDPSTSFEVSDRLLEHHTWRPGRSAAHSCLLPQLCVSWWCSWSVSRGVPRSRRPAASSPPAFRALHARPCHLRCGTRASPYRARLSQYPRPRIASYPRRSAPAAAGTRWSVRPRRVRSESASRRRRPPPRQPRSAPPRRRRLVDEIAPQSV